ncbi:MAG: hypothetical protein JWO44_1788 [Bacteroidetes bacterium]|nr:hypothetical protein [Bacteroidota bacterium]
MKAIETPHGNCSLFKKTFDIKNSPGNKFYIARTEYGTEDSSVWVGTDGNMSSDGTGQYDCGDYHTDYDHWFMSGGRK